jgi:hypothetical protein
VHLVAPGICSYVAASCGGALGRLCLTTQQDQEEQEEDWTGAGWGDGWDGWDGEFLRPWLDGILLRFR